MNRNVTLRLDEAVLRKARHAAVEEDKSLSEWVADLVERETSDRQRKEKARLSALNRLRKGLNLGGIPLSRAEAHERRSDLR